MKKLLTLTFFKNWKTSLLGIGGTATITLGQMIQTGHVDFNTLLTGIVVGLIGIFSKDATKTGL